MGVMGEAWNDAIPAECFHIEADNIYIAQLVIASTRRGCVESLLNGQYSSRLQPFCEFLEDPAYVAKKNLVMKILDEMTKQGSEDASALKRKMEEIITDICAQRSLPSVPRRVGANGSFPSVRLDA